MSEFRLDKLPKKALAQIDLQTAFMAARCVLAAEHLKLFRKLSGKALSSAAIGRATGLKQPKRDFFLAALIALGLLKKTGDRYRNTALAEKYFVRERSVHWTGFYSTACMEEYQAFSVLEEMLTTGRGFEDILGTRRRYYVEQMQDSDEQARAFTHMLYYHHLPESRALTAKLDLGGRRRLLDVGGGSGVMSIALARKYPKLKATVFDIEPVCRVARQIIRREKMSRRVDTLAGDMTKSLPEGYDVVMFCDSYSSEDNLSRAYRSLPEGGLLVVADMFSSEDYTEPFLRLMWQLRSDRAWLETRKEALEKVKKCGFRSVKMRKLHGDFWLITGVKGRSGRRG
jgi:cyclopropane fatty-acyl-phospholipid synthase-like methyltransferase